MQAREQPKTEYIKLDDLLFDTENPRFARREGTTNQKTIAKILWDEMFLEELVLSIGVNGYYVQEPLLVIKDKQNEGKYIVVEGNRRLATVKILTDNKLAKEVKASGLPDQTPDQLARLKKLPALVYGAREDLWTYLSFRHVNGPRSWSSISKAEFVANLYFDKEISFDEIVNSTGDKNKTIIKMLNGLIVLRQGETQTRFTREDFNAAKFNFSHLYTIIQYPNTKKHLGIDNLDQAKPFPQNPVPEDKLGALEELLIWIFGSKSVRKQSVIKSQNPDLRELDDIVKSAPALVSLRDDGVLSVAHEFTDEEDRRLQDLVIKAYNALQKAMGLADSFKGDEDVIERLDKIQKFAKQISDRATKKD